MTAASVVVFVVGFGIIVAALVYLAISDRRRI